MENIFHGNVLNGSVEDIAIKRQGSFLTEKKTKKLDSLCITEEMTPGRLFVLTFDEIWFTIGS